MHRKLASLIAAASFALAGSALAGSALAMGSTTDTPAAKPADPDFARAKAMIEARDYKAAIPLLQQVVAKDGKNAEGYNLLGFATRKSGDPQGSLQYYQQALAIDAKHLGAHEYIGEAYLMLDRLPDAEQHLTRLDSLCVFGCAEQRMLKTAVANYKAGKKPTN
jgi:Flp pilus assembly protein TadD